MANISNNNNTGKKISNGLNLDIIWVLVILSGFLVVISLFPLPPNDFWWHLEIGKYIFSNHSIPTANIYAWSLPSDQPFFYAAWLGEFLLYWFYHIGGLSLDIFIRTLLAGISFWLVASEAKRRSGSWRIAAIVVTLACLMSLNNLIVRTQMWAWIPFIITYIVLKRYTEGNISKYWLILCPICMIFWVNVHGSYILGWVLAGFFFLGQVVSKLTKQTNALNWHQIGWIGCIGLLCGLAAMINPRFTDIIRYTINLLTDRSSQQLIEEWQSPSPQGIANITFFISILIFIIVLAVSRYRLNPTELLLITGFLWLAWSGQRYVIWYGIVAMPILAQLISKIPMKLPVFVPQKNWYNLALVILLFIPFLAVQPWFVERLPLPATYWRQVQRASPAGPLVDGHTPVAAAEYLHTHPGGRLFNELGYGSYLIWANPGQTVFIDARIELYPYDQWQDYINISNGTNYNKILMKYGIDRIILDKQLQSKLASSLSEDPLWTLEYEDQIAQIWSKTLNP